MERLQELEDDLNDDQLLTLIDLFRTDSSSVNAYLNLLDFEDLRKTWVQTIQDIVHECTQRNASFLAKTAMAFIEKKNRANLPTNPTYSCR